MALTQISTQGIKDGTITGTDLATNVDLVDNQKLRLGTGNDLELYHDSSHSIINDSFGSLLVRSDIVQISTPAGSKYFKGQSGVAELYHSDSKKFETASHGVEVIGKLTFAGDGHTQGIELGADADIVFYHDNSDGYLDNNVGDLYLRNDGNSTSEKVRIQAKGGEQSIICSPNGTVELYYDNSKKLETSSSGVSVTGTLNLGSGDLTLTGNINISDSSGGGNNRLIFGVSDDLQIWHDGSDSYIADEGTGALKILSNLFRVNNAANDEAMIKAEENAGVTLSFNGSTKFETRSGGAAVSGHLELGDNDKVMLGDSNDLQFFHDGVGSIIQNNTGPTIIRGAGSNVDIRNSNDEIMIRCNGGGSVDIRNNGSQRFATTSSGNHSYGQMTFDGRIYPNTDNAYTCGLSNRRWTEVCAVNGSINTSDKTEKNTIVESDLGLDFINKLKPISYKWNKDDGKTHYGLIAQDLEETLTSLGKTIADFGGIYKEDDSPMGLGYSELIAPLIKAVQELSTEVAALKAA